MTPGRDLSKLAGILGMLSSNHDGERAAAALAATRFLKARGWSWIDVLHPPALPPPSCRPVRPAAGPDAKANLALCSRSFTRLNEWEAAFVTALSQRQQPLTPGQVRKLGEITSRLRREGCT